MSDDILARLALLRERMTPRLRARTPVPGKAWYEIRNAEGDEDKPAVVRIYEPIDSWGYPWGVSAVELADELDQVTADKIRVEINSRGGEVFEGIAIYNALRAHPAEVTTRIDGIAASAASVIAQAGDRRLILSSAQTMIHEAWGLCVGPAGDMREMADLLDKINGSMAELYARHAGGEVDEWRQLLASGDVYLTDQETVDKGLADEVVENPSAAARAQGAELDELALTVGRLEPAFDLDELAAKIAARLNPTSGPPGPETPPAGQREEHATDPVVDHEQAGRLLSELSFAKEA